MLNVDPEGEVDIAGIDPAGDGSADAFLHMGGIDPGLGLDPEAEGTDGGVGVGVGRGRP
jgi:hypothetical protein